MTNLILAYDTETTGLVSKSEPLNSPSQPHIVSLSALQVRVEDVYIQQSMSRLVAPDYWDWDDSNESPDRAFQVHKLKVNHCLKFGSSEQNILDSFLDLWLDGEAELVAHNLDFDRHVIGCAIARYHGMGELLTDWMAAPGTCTMLSSKNIVLARTKPNAKGQTRAKNPNLAEAYEFFTGEPLEDHHSANKDAVAALQIYLGIQEHNEQC